MAEVDTPIPSPSQGTGFQPVADEGTFTQTVAIQIDTISGRDPHKKEKGWLLRVNPFSIEAPAAFQAA